MLATTFHETGVIRNILHDSFPEWKGIDTPRVLRACRRLSSKGLVEAAFTHYATMKSWQITPGGRALLSTGEAPS